MSGHKDFPAQNPVEYTNEVRKKEIIIKILLLVILILLGVTLSLTSIMFIYDSDRQYAQHTNNIENENMTTTEITLDKDSKMKLNTIHRIDWLAQPPENASFLSLPVPNVIILHTATDNCTTQAKCIGIVRNIQSYHMDIKGWWDIGYNFLIGGDGYVYEGRGWKVQGAHTYGWNSESIGIAFIGNFNNVLAPERQILAAKMLIEKGVKDGYLLQDYQLFAQQQVNATQSPGKMLYENIKMWPHWTEMPTSL